jgi:hypothetical protein
MPMKPENPKAAMIDSGETITGHSIVDERIMDVPIPAKMPMRPPITVEFDGINREGLEEYLEEPFSVVVVFEYLPPFIITAGYMINSSVVLYANRPGHGRQ